MTSLAHQTNAAGPSISTRSRAIRAIESLPANPLFAYATILLLQFKLIWKIWQYKDLTSGDTCGYFGEAWSWFTLHRINILWSPLYTIYYGSFLHLSQNVYAITILHRMLIVLASAALVLAVMRRLLPAWLAWLAAAWWVILPVNFDALYEVHQFAVLPILLIWLIALRKNSGPWTRGWSIALLLATAVLVRNEMIIALGFFTLFCLYEEWRRRRDPASPSLASTLAAYLIPLLLSLLVLAWFYQHSQVKYPQLSEALEQKHTLNMAQVYAFGYSQRHPEWTQSPWTEYAALCQRDFGSPTPTLGQMLRRNPKALTTQILWNFRLLPAGLQLLLFNRASGNLNPDYVPVHLNSRNSFLYSILVLTIVALGLIFWWRNLTEWKSRFASRRLGWAAMLSVVAVTPAIVITQRPRPEYLFPLGIFMMAVVAIAVWIILSRLPAPRLLKILMPALMIAAPFLAKPFYGPDIQLYIFPTYAHLRPFQSAIDRPDVVFLKGEQAAETSYYLGHGHGTVLPYAAVFSDWPASQTLDQLLDHHNVNLFYVDQNCYQILQDRRLGAFLKFFAEAGAHGWHLIAYQQSSDNWWLFQRTPAPNSATHSTFSPVKE